MNNWRIILVAALLLIFDSQVTAQNLVVNPGFEDMLECPKRIVGGKRKLTVENWKLPTKGTADYMNKCSDRYTVSVPENFAGSQPARNGDGYVHVLAGKSTGFNYTEYVEGQLSQPLITGETYVVEFWVSLGERSSLSASCLGAFLSPNKTTRKGSRPLKLEPQIKSTDFITDTEGWVRVSGFYVAQGKEQYIIIGAYPKRKSKDYKARLNGELARIIVGNAMANYYIDDVKVERVASPEPIFTEKERTDSSDPVVLENVVFETNSSVLMNTALPELDSLVLYLKEERGLRIQLNGHTDNIGSEEDNQELSFNRVTAVKEYLIQSGIDVVRLKCMGFGSSAPLQTNTTEAGRQTNRRVEFVILEE